MGNCSSDVREPVVPPRAPSFFALVAKVGARSAGSAVPAPRDGSHSTQGGLGDLASLRGRWWPAAIPARSCASG